MVQEGIVFNNQFLDEEMFIEQFTKLLQEQPDYISQTIIPNAQKVLDTINAVEHKITTTQSIASVWNDFKINVLLNNSLKAQTYLHVYTNIENEKITEYTATEANSYRIDNNYIKNFENELKNTNALITKQQVSAIISAHWSQMQHTINTDKASVDEIQTALNNFNETHNRIINKVTTKTGKTREIKRRDRMHALLDYASKQRANQFTYKQDLWSKESTGQLGTLYEAFITHMVLYHKSINMKNNIRLSNTVHGEEKNNFYSLLLDAVGNNNSWYTGGDIIIYDNMNNKILYNLQVKTMKNNEFNTSISVSTKRLKGFMNQLINNIKFQQKTPEQQAKILYQRLKTDGYVTRTNNRLNQDINDIIDKNLQ